MAKNKVTITATTAVVATIICQRLIPDRDRSYLLIQNQGSDIVFVKFGSTINSNEGIEISAGGMWEPTLVPVDSIWFLANSGSQTCVVVEGSS